MHKLTMIICATLSAGVLTSAAQAQPEQPLDYTNGRTWICRPDKLDGCRDDLTTLVIHADGSTQRRPFAPAKAPKVDCFYVYPTVSNGPGVTAPPTISDDERRAVRQQFQRFASLCRLYAPVYRQITLTSMKAAMRGDKVTGMDEAVRIAEGDVTAAWKDYLARDNHGRGVILIGHSQGAGILRDLIRREIDGRPLQNRLIVAILPGSGLMVSKGRDVGGDFKTVPVCRRRGQFGCVIGFNTYRADHPIPEREVIKPAEDQEAVCANPAALGGGRGDLNPILSARGETIIPDFTRPQGPWTQPPRTIDTPFVALPGLFHAECRHDSHGTYLAITTDPKPGDRRTRDYTGDWTAGYESDATMGLHLIDLNLTMGDLLEVVGEQIVSYRHAYR
jgi:hypothetical protein